MRDRNRRSTGFIGAIAAVLALHLLQIYYASGYFAVGYAFLVLLFALVGVLSIFVGIVLNALKRLPGRHW